MEEKSFFAKEEHFCPYNKNTTCSGWDCDIDCPVHPDYEDYDEAFENRKGRKYEKLDGKPYTDVFPFVIERKETDTDDFYKGILVGATTLYNMWRCNLFIDDNLPFTYFSERNLEECEDADFPYKIEREEKDTEDYYKGYQAGAKCMYDVIYKDAFAEGHTKGYADGYENALEKYGIDEDIVFDEDEFESEEEIEKHLEAYDEGWQQGYKKGYIAAMEDEDAWVEDEDEDFEKYGMCKDLEDLEDTPYTWDKPIDCQDDLPQKNHPCERIRNFVGGANPCITCDCEECPVGDLEDEDLEELENLYQSGELEPDIAKAYEMGKNYGYDLGLAYGSNSIEDAYVEGYKDCFLGVNPCIYDEDLEDFLEQDKAFEDYKSVPAGLDIDTDIIDSLEVLKNELIDLKRGYLDREDIDDKQFINRVMSMLHNICIIQENYVKEALFRYLDYK